MDRQICPAIVGVETPPAARSRSILTTTLPIAKATVLEGQRREARMQAGGSERPATPRSAALRSMTQFRFSQCGFLTDRRWRQPWPLSGEQAHAPAPALDDEAASRPRIYERIALRAPRPSFYGAAEFFAAPRYRPQQTQASFYALRNRRRRYDQRAMG